MEERTERQGRTRVEWKGEGTAGMERIGREINKGAEQKGKGKGRKGKNRKGRIGRPQE